MATDNTITTQSLDRDIKTLLIFAFIAILPATFLLLHKLYVGNPDYVVATPLKYVLVLAAFSISGNATSFDWKISETARDDFRPYARYSQHLLVCAGIALIGALACYELFQIFAAAMFLAAAVHVAGVSYSCRRKSPAF